MRMKIQKLLMLAVMGASLAIGTARPSAAATITYDVTFSAALFTTFSSATPKPLVMGRASVTFDPTGDIASSSNGTLNYLDPFTLPAAIIFSYTKASDTFVLAGPLNGFNSAGGTDDFYLSVKNFTSGSPILEAMFYTETASLFTAFYSQTGFVHVDAIASNVATTPIPAALPLLISALGGLGLVGWRRRKSTAA
jgi:hypothetical protein